MPSSDATGDWLRRSGSNSGLDGLDKVKRRALKRGLKYDGIKGYSLDIDATGIEAEKEAAKMTYKGYTGYMPIVGHLAENGLIIGDEFRQGNASPCSRNLEFMQSFQCVLEFGHLHWHVDQECIFFVRITSDMAFVHHVCKYKNVHNCVFVMPDHSKFWHFSFFSGSSHAGIRCQFQCCLGISDVFHKILVSEQTCCQTVVQQDAVI